MLDTVSFAVAELEQLRPVCDDLLSSAVRSVFGNSSTFDVAVKAQASLSVMQAATAIGGVLPVALVQLPAVMDSLLTQAIIANADAAAVVNNTHPVNVTVAGSVAYAANVSAVADLYASYTLSLSGGARCLQCAVTALQRFDAALMEVKTAADAAAAFAHGVPAMTATAVGVLNNTVLPIANATITAVVSSFDATRKQMTAGAIEEAIMNFASFEFRASLQVMQEVVTSVTVSLENAKVRRG